MKVLFLLSLFLNILFAYTKTSDSKNVYWSSTHFRVIAGNSYSNDSSIISYASNILDVAENSWKKEVDELGFKRPRNSDSKLIDIYIGDILEDSNTANMGPYNYETNTYEKISRDYAGWAISYPSDNTPYFLLSPILNLDLLKVTIAHEFFHTIQYAYYDESKITYEYWENDIWWLEATATMMEDEVYDSINDYIRYVDIIFKNSYKSFEVYDGWSEYSRVIFAKYLKEKFGLELIKRSLELYESSNGDVFSILDTILKDEYSSSMKEALKEFSIWLITPAKYFEEGSLYPPLQRFSKNSYKQVESRGGVLVVNNLDNIYLSSKSNYNMVNANGEENLTVDSGDDVIFSNFTDFNISFSTLDIRNYIKVSDGWSMVKVPSIERIDDISRVKVIWAYYDSSWFYYSEDSEIDSYFASSYGKIDFSKEYSGYWVYTTDEIEIDFSDEQLVSLDYSTLSNKWNLVTTFENINDLELFSDSVQALWQYKDSKWYSKRFDDIDISEYGIEELGKIGAKESFWLQK